MRAGVDRRRERRGKERSVEVRKETVRDGRGSKGREGEIRFRLRRMERVKLGRSEVEMRGKKETTVKYVSQLVFVLLFIFTLLRKSVKLHVSGIYYQCYLSLSYEDRLDVGELSLVTLCSFTSTRRHNTHGYEKVPPLCPSDMCSKEGRKEDF